MTTFDLASKFYSKKLIIGSNGLKFIDYLDEGNPKDIIYILFDNITSIANITNYCYDRNFGFKIKAKQMGNVNVMYQDFDIKILDEFKANLAYKLISDGFNESCKKKDERIGI